jgi:hypothetical protein
VEVLVARSSETLIQNDRLNHLAEFFIGFFLLGIQIRDFFLQCCESVSLLIELSRVALQESLFLGAALEGFHVFAQARLIGGDAVLFLAALLHLGFTHSDLVLLAQNFPETLPNLPAPSAGDFVASPF